MRATVIVPTFNRAELLDQTLKTLEQSVIKGGHSIFVGDDGSSDHTADIVASYKAKGLSIDYKYWPDEGFRASRARNGILQTAAHELLIFVDTGIIVSPDFIDQHIKVHRSRTLPRLVLGPVHGFDRNNENRDYILSKSSNDTWFNDAVNDPLIADPRQKLFDSCDGDLSKLDAPWAICWSCNISVLKDVFGIVGGFNENFKSWGGEDTDFAYRLHRVGTRAALAKHALAFHLPHDKFGDDLQPQSVSNFLRETAKYTDTKPFEVMQLGDIDHNLK